MGILKHIIVYFYLTLFLTIHLITFSNGKVTFLGSGYYYAYLLLMIIPSIILALIYFWVYTKFEKIQWILSICFLFILILIPLIIGIKNNQEDFISHLQPQKNKIHFFEMYIPFLILGLILSVLMGLLLNQIMKWFIKIDNRIKRM